MRVTIRSMFIAGHRQRLAFALKSPKLTGELTIEQVGKRTVAILKESDNHGNGTRRAELVEPRLAGANEHGMFLDGYESALRDNLPCEVRQGWLVSFGRQAPA